MAEPEPPSERLTSSLFDRIKEFFTNMWTTWWETDPDITNPLFSAAGKMMAERFGDTGIEYLNESLLKSVENLGLPDKVKETINKVIKDGDLGSLLLGYFITLMYYLSYISGHSAVASELSSHTWRNEYRPTLPDVASLILTMYRDPAKAEAVREQLHKHGYTDTNIDTLFAASKSIPGLTELKDLFLRGEIDEASLDAGMEKYGFAKGEIDALKKLFYPIPSYPDLIRMAVREAFYPDYVQEFGLLQELPGEYVSWAKKQGLTEEWAKHYWASHWELPSILRGYEMLHRGVITNEELDSLFMAADIMPWWRDKLLAISYHPLTRVDVRRVYRMGIIDREQVKRTYLDLGYNDEKAEWLTRFTEMQNTEADRDLSKAEILSAYAKKIITEGECKSMLTDLGYSTGEVDILISMKDYQEVKEMKDREEKRIKKYYLAGVYNINQAINALGKLDLVGTEQDSIISLWESEKLAKLRAPSKKDLDSLFSANVVSEKQYTDELKHLGYSDKYVTWFLTLVKQKGAEE